MQWTVKCIKMEWCGFVLSAITNLTRRSMSLSTLKESIMSMMDISANLVSKYLKLKPDFKGIIKIVNLSSKMPLSWNKWLLSIELVFCLEMEAAVNNMMYKDDEMMWTCRDCHYQSRMKGHVFEHIEGKHQVYDGYLCSHCQHVFKTKGYLQRHNKKCQA